MEFEGWMFAGIAMRVRRAYYSCTSHILPFRKMRWTTTLALLCVYFQTAQPNYPLPSYLLVFYLLHLAVAYLTPHGIALALDDQQDEQ
jgi:Rer1 family